MTMDKETRNKQIAQYLDESAAEFDSIVAAGEQQRRKRVRWTVLLGSAAAAAVALILWLVPARPAASPSLTPIQIAEGIQQIMLLNIGDIEAIEATPMASYAILTARLKDGSTCSYILQCNDVEGTTTLLAYTDNHNH